MRHVDHLGSCRLNHNRLSLSADGLLARGLQVPGLLSPLAHALNRLRHVLLLVDIGVAEFLMSQARFNWFILASTAGNADLARLPVHRGVKQPELAAGMLDHRLQAEAHAEHRQATLVQRD